MTSSRRAALEEMVAADPDDLMARLLLGNDCLAEGDAAAAEPHLARYVAGLGGPQAHDAGAACLSLAKAREALGDLAGARAALDAGIASATAFRHRALLDALVAEQDRLLAR